MSMVLRKYITKPVSVSLEKCAKAIAVSIYHSEGLETMNYTGESDYADKEWGHYEDQAKAVLDAAGVKYVD